VEVEPDANFDSLGVSHTPFEWMLAIMDFPQPHYRDGDQNIEPYRNEWASQVLKLKVHEKAHHVDIESSSNPMDSLQGYLFPEVLIVPSWESIEASSLAYYLVVLPAYFHVHNLSVWNHLLCLKLMEAKEYMHVSLEVHAKYSPYV
jgi:hypothetical protein